MKVMMTMMVIMQAVKLRLHVQQKCPYLALADRDWKRQAEVEIVTGNGKFRSTPVVKNYSTSLWPGYHLRTTHAMLSSTLNEYIMSSRPVTGKIQYTTRPQDHDLRLPHTSTVLHNYVASLYEFPAIFAFNNTSLRLR